MENLEREQIKKFLKNQIVVFIWKAKELKLTTNGDQKI